MVFVVIFHYFSISTAKWQLSWIISMCLSITFHLEIILELPRLLQNAPKSAKKSIDLNFYSILVKQHMSLHLYVTWLSCTTTIRLGAIDANIRRQAMYVYSIRIVATACIIYTVITWLAVWLAVHCGDQRHLGYPTKAQPCVPLISTKHGQPFLIPLVTNDALVELNAWCMS